MPNHKICRHQKLVRAALGLGMSEEVKHPASRELTVLVWWWRSIH